MASQELTKLSIEQSPASTEPLVETSVGKETATQTVSRIKSALATPTTPEAPAPNRPIKEPKSETTPDFYGKAYDDVSREAQKRINKINLYADEKLKSLQPRQDERLKETSSVNTLTGLAGSTEANRTTEKTNKVNQQEDDLVRAEAATQVATIMDGLSTKALEKAKFDRESYTAEVERTAEEEKAQKEEMVTNATTLAQSGVTAEGFKTQNPDEYAYLAEALGGEEYLKATFTLNRPVEQVLDKRIENGKYVIAYQNPIDGKVRLETVDLGLPANYSKTIDAGNRILAVPDNWDGDPSKLITINKGLTPGQAQTAGTGTGASGEYTTDLDAIIGATEAIIPSKFGQATFRAQMAKARNEADKINLVASIVLGKADSATKTDFSNQAVGINQIDKAIKMLDEGTKTGALQAGAQYAYNLVGKDFDPKLAQINQLITSAIQPYRNSVTGAAWGTQEDGEYQQLFGSTKYSPVELKQRLEGIKEILTSKSAQALNTYVNPMGLYNNPFETGDLAPGGDLRTRVDEAGFDYDKMKADGLSDEQIESSL